MYISNIKKFVVQFPSDEGGWRESRGIIVGVESFFIGKSIEALDLALQEVVNVVI
jgi:hypothetical protein